MKKILVVFRNMPDTLPKFGGDCKCSFRDLAPPVSALVGGENHRFSGMKKFCKPEISKTTFTIPTKFWERVRHVPKDFQKNFWVVKLSIVVFVCNLKK